MSNSVIKFQVEVDADWNYADVPTEKREEAIRLMYDYGLAIHVFNFTLLNNAFDRHCVLMSDIVQVLKLGEMFRDNPLLNFHSGILAKHLPSITAIEAKIMEELSVYFPECVQSFKSNFRRVQNELKDAQFSKVLVFLNHFPSMSDITSEGIASKEQWASAIRILDGFDRLSREWGKCNLEEVLERFKEDPSKFSDDMRNLYANQPAIVKFPPGWTRDRSGFTEDTDEALANLESALKTFLKVFKQ